MDKNKLYQRIIALILIGVPISISVYGWTLLRESVISYLLNDEENLLEIVWAFFAFIIGLAILAGGIWNHERKRRYPKR